MMSVLSPIPSATGKDLLVLGLGNEILSDDGVGLHIAREVRRRLHRLHNLEVYERSDAGLSLLDDMVGFDELILIDAIQTGRAPVGSLHEFGAEQLEVRPIRSPHGFGVSEVIALGQQLGLPVPKRVRVLAVEVNDPFTVGTELTPALRLALPELVQRVTHLIKKAITENSR